MKTLAVLYPGCIEFEILLACELLNKHLPVEVATPEGKEHLGSNGMSIKASFSYQDIDSSKYKVLLIPGGDPGSVIGNEFLIKIVKQAHTQNSILAAICAGPVILEQARLLDGRSIAHGYAGPQKEWLSSQGYFKKTKLTSEPIIIDGNIITCRPDCYIDFAISVTQLAGCFSQERGEILKNYYRGMNS